MVGLTGVYLVAFFGLRIELTGTGIVPMFSFGSVESHYMSLERHRGSQKSSGVISEPSTGEDAVSVPVSSAAVESEPTSTEPVIHPSEENVDIDGSRYWTQFRGPGMDGHYREMPILTDWPAEGLELLWKQPVGGGYASFVVADGLAFTIEQRRDEETLAAYELATGREIWTYAWKAEFTESMGGDGPRATPTWHEGRLYALGATGELKVLEAATGELVWDLNILSDNGAKNLQWGMAASPLIVDDKVVVLPGGSRGRSVVAYDKLTGEPVWKSLNDPQAYTSPMLVHLAGRRQILVVSRERAMGLAPEDGSIIWDYPWTTSYGVNAAQPILLSEDRSFISAGYGHGAAVVEIRLEGGRYSAHTVWENTRMKNQFSASVLHDGYIYGLDGAILACLDAETGERMWKGGRYGHGEVLLASDHLVVSTERGDLALVRATPESHQERARFSAIRGKTWNHPAIADGILLVRNASEMAAFRLAAR
jgi:outer membrane protein assembly factor BamB